MSDFLASLIDRAANRAPVLERRRPSLFEPAVPGPRDPDATVPDLSREPREPDAGLELETRIEREGGAPRTQPSKRRPLRPARHAEGESEAAENESADPEVESARSSSKRRPTFPKREPAEAAVETGPPQPDPGLALEISKTIRTGQQNESPRDLRTPPPRLKRGDELERTAPDSVLASPREELKPVRPGTANSRVPQTSPPVPNSRSEERLSALPLKLVPSRPRELAALTRLPRSGPKLDSIRTQPPPPAPSPIHVTIGRIEVRANPTPDTPPRARKPAAPRLSLDDYLRSRNGGAR